MKIIKSKEHKNKSAADEKSAQCSGCKSYVKLTITHFYDTQIHEIITHTYNPARVQVKHIHFQPSNSKIWDRLNYISVELHEGGVVNTTLHNHPKDERAAL